LRHAGLLERGKEVGLGRGLIADRKDQGCRQIGPTRGKVGIAMSNDRPTSSTIR
jgi:hypothetical protein